MKTSVVKAVKPLVFLVGNSVAAGEASPSPRGKGLQLYL